MFWFLIRLLEFVLCINMIECGGWGFEIKNKSQIFRFKSGKWIKKYVVFPSRLKIIFTQYCINVSMLCNSTHSCASYELMKKYEYE